ncbi:hypothetical protein PFTANZ_04561 [Plasmodium falciparum Tanzania (2000708)]|uniref:Uncharacterized protein n=1 Tax=Plasmodium falciparum Tanzania (2000708) TaxID=1036725 RepID=A0A024W264_PLAFA|nr:hypothetical protein PFTANZ_04561 [Plasmodium falciparum Tanzania (2000708)]
MIDNFYKFLEKKKNDIKNELNNITTDVSKMMNQLSWCSSTFNDTYLYKAKNLLQSTYNVIK